MNAPAPASRRPLALLAALGKIALLPAAQAAPAPAARNAALTARVRISDLDLRTEQGTQVLLERLEKAAHAVCTPESYRDLAALSAAADCRHQAMRDALAQLQSTDAPRLALHTDLARR